MEELDKLRSSIEHSIQQAAFTSLPSYPRSALSADLIEQAATTTLPPSPDIEANTDVVDFANTDGVSLALLKSAIDDAKVNLLKKMPPPPLPPYPCAEKHTVPAFLEHEFHDSAHAPLMPLDGESINLPDLAPLAPFPPSPVLKVNTDLVHVSSEEASSTPLPPSPIGEATIILELSDVENTSSPSTPNDKAKVNMYLAGLRGAESAPVTPPNKPLPNLPVCERSTI